MEDILNATRSIVGATSPMRDVSRRVTVAQQEQPLSECRGVMQRTDSYDPNGKLLFVFGLCGFTADEIAHDRWVMI